MSEDEERGLGSDAAAIPLADGGAKHQAAEGAQTGNRIEHDLAKKQENAVLSCFIVI